MAEAAITSIKRFTVRAPLVAWGLYTLVVCVGLILFVDVPLTLMIHEHMPQDVQDVFEVITHFGNSAIWYGLSVGGAVVCLCVAGLTASETLHYRYRRYARGWWFMVVSMLTSGILVNMMKVGFGRYRPRFLFDEGLQGFEPFRFAVKDLSFPSGHAQSIAAAAVALMFLYPRFTPLYLLMGALVAASRVILARPHFLSDIVAGVFVGAVVAILWHRQFTGGENGTSVELTPLEDGR